MRPPARLRRAAAAAASRCPGMPFGTVAERRFLPARLLALGPVVAERRVVGGEHLEHAVRPGRPRSPAGWPCRAAAGCRRTWRRRSRRPAPGRRRSGTGTAGRSRRNTFRPVPLRPADLLDRLAAGDVHDQDRHVDQFGQRDRAVRRLALDQHRPRLRVEARRGAAGAPRALRSATRCSRRSRRGSSPSRRAGARPRARRGSGGRRASGRRRSCRS